MRANWNSWSKNKNYHHMIIKLTVAILLLGLAFRLFVSNYKGFASDFESPVSEKLQAPYPDVKSPVNVGIPENEDQMPHDVVPEKCNLFTGEWIPDPSGPAYTNESCSLIENHQNCMMNGRPDSGYLHWKWKPHGCRLPRFDAKKFLVLMRDKSWALIGDSISRNHVQSLLCMLATVERPIEVYHSAENKTKRWHFPSSNLTILNIWSPFLVKAAIFEDINGVSSAPVELHLDKLDKAWLDIYHSLDYMIISAGKWFVKSAIYHEHDVAVGCHMCPGKNLTEVGLAYAYNKTLHYAMDFIVKSKHKGLIFLRTSTPDHFENGAWDDGGNCLRTMPAKEGEIKMKDLTRILRDIELEQFEKASTKAAGNKVNLKLLDFSNLLLSRPDGHPGPYRHYYPYAENKTAVVQNDCLHWCLLGPLDSWNDVIMDIVVDKKQNDAKKMKEMTR